MDKNLEGLLLSCGCRDINELWGYIDYLEHVKQDYEFLKARVRATYDIMQQLY